MADVEGFREEATRIIHSLCRNLMTQDTDANLCEASLITLTALSRNARRMCTRYPIFERLCEIIDSLMSTIEERKRTLQPLVGFFAAKQTTTRGRPLYVISREQLEYLVEAGFKRRAIASLLQVSDSVIKRSLRSYGISIRGRYSSISNEELDNLVREITDGNQTLGQRMVQGHLQSLGHRVQRQRVADSLIRVDEAAVAMRWCHSIRRRVYNVAGPNSLWHIDGNHKLIRWGFVIHGGIDGFSRMCVFLQAATNNKATTMTKAFMTGTQCYGVPSRVRSNHGLENTGVGAFMVAHRGPRRGSFITGRSVHNQRIERMWRDLFASATNVFHGLFSHLEESGQLDLTNPVHMWCLHHVFVPRVQRALDIFREGWNCHRLSSERGRTPTQLFIEGMMRQAGQGHRGIDDMVFRAPEEAIQDHTEYGIDDEVEVAPREDMITNVSNVDCPLNEQDFTRLTQTLNIESDHQGVDCFLACVEFCNSV
ncbi:uncharacterized protein LOC127880799 [Dreissena polymorpha]|uniref:Integrase catalytic domain-containing protein n=1 Tax=Dreissena polymorpha TaxID=45954 RepID=A0A9D4H5R6_DREPO|nr:uncharacterized protein LOC127880799 [Dreissena polymorpha]KAH3829073.1 hypothetical protein DPMN_131061 [Dreissena polymorpha]